MSESTCEQLYQTLKGRHQDIEALKTEASRIYEAVGLQILMLVIFTN
jgi:hypothetical protein